MKKVNPGDLLSTTKDYINLIFFFYHIDASSAWVYQYFSDSSKCILCEFGTASTMEPFANEELL